MYALFLIISFCVTYIILLFLFPAFFGHKREPMTKKSLLSLSCIILFSLISYKIAYSIENKEVGNRILHGLGGGVLALLVCFFVVKDSKIPITRFQFFFLGFLLVTALGVANEIMEFILQHYFNISFARTSTDTWLDLVSNTVGALVASSLVLPFIKKPK